MGEVGEPKVLTDYVRHFLLNRQTKCKRQTKSNCDSLNAKNVVKSIKNSIN